MSEDTPDIQKRQHFRISYPPKNRAQLNIDRTDYPVVDISQRGIRISFDKIDEYAEWADRIIVKGRLRFLVGEEFSVVGKVLRVMEEELEVVLQIKDDIPLKTMNDEHRHLIKNYNWKE